MPLDTDKNRPIATTAHWGTYYAEVENGKLTGLRDYEKDPSPSIIGQGILEALDDKVRVRRPMVRKGFLENGKSSNRKLKRLGSSFKSIQFIFTITGARNSQSQN